MTDRTRLRATLRAARRAIPAAARIDAAQRLAVRLLALPGFPARGHVAGYWSMDGEIALHAFQLALPAALTYCLPVLTEGRRLAFATFRAGDAVRPNRYGIPEPAVEPDEWIEPQALALAIVPLVGFDAAGHRLGMGGGWYDRSFAFRRDPRAASPRLVGAAFSVQQLDSLAPEAWDVPLDAACTERETFLFDHSRDHDERPERR